MKIQISVSTSVYPEDFESAVTEKFDPTYAESEGQDFRLDFHDASVWMRGGRSVEGILPKSMKTKMDAIVKKLKLRNDIKYV